jgi:hypothetical protein
VSVTSLPPPPPAEPRRGRQTRIVEPSQPRGRRTATRGRGGKARISRQQDRSPTPGTSDIDPEELESLQLATGETPGEQSTAYIHLFTYLVTVTAGSQYTWEYETVPHDAFIKYAATKLGSPDLEDLQRRGTQNVVEMLRVAEEDATAQMGSSRRKAKV